TLTDKSLFSVIGGNSEILEDKLSKIYKKKIPRDEAIKLAVFPNPANSTIYLNSSKNIEYQILSSEGKLLMQGSCTGAITIATLPKGVYFLNLRSESEIQIIKFIKLNSQF
ncbi:MAG: T9SS type A sorting domain-containing protein, partial [Bacteroidia bacterium]